MHRLQQQAEHRLRRRLWKANQIMCETCIKLRKAAFAVIRTVLPKPKDEKPDTDRTIRR
jgi:hypothetical protein